MNMYEAVKATAAQISARPDLYNFSITRIPDEGGLGYNGQGCILGRLAQIAGFKDDCNGADAAAGPLLGVIPHIFFNRISHIMLERLGASVPDLHQPALVVPALCIYAEMYRSELETREYPIPAIPPAVRQIFNPQTFNGLFLGAGVAASTVPAPAKPLPGEKYSIALDTYIAA